MATVQLSDAQWQQLLAAPPAIARAVSAAAGPLKGTELELEAFVGLVDRTAHEDSSDGLLGDLAARLHASLSSGAVAAPGDDVVAEGIHAARQAGALLAVLPDEAAARAVRLWLMRVANTVAAASREGGLLGIGGEDVSRPERDTLNAIADALGLSGEPGA
ncbi:MAG TPA: hypothetical protein VK992_06320 [Candidatus Caenarcaniphilales bacterium]|nr:hypothetical protein [Candidatus Caenarcaniphilales bacterium]